MINSIRSAFSVILILIYSQVAFAQTAAILPQASTQFFDSNGDPLSSGTVNFYIPNTSTPKTTWQDPDQVTQNPNTITLDAAGRALIWGVGSYRMLVKAQNGNIIYDKPTSATGSGGGGGGGTGDGNMIGTVLEWAGLVAPNQYVFAYGQEISRVTYPEYYQAVTSTQAIFCTLGSPTLSGIGDTTQLPIGAPVEASCIPTGSIIASKTASTVTLNNNAIVATNTTATFFPYGNGNGINTFNVLDRRGKAGVGRNNMGGVASSNLTQTYYGANPNAIGANGGAESQTLTIAQLPIHNHPVFLYDQGHAHSTVFTTVAVNSGGGSALAGSGGAVSVGSQSAMTGLQVRSQAAGAGTINQTGDTGSGSPYQNIQPSLTMNYIVKIVPDTSSLVATGVSSLGGMVGVIACGAGLNCSGNIISVGSIPIVGDALTKTDDTNVTLTLGGSPSNALVNAASLTLGWAGQLSVARGGTGAATFTANAPLIGNGTSPVAVGTRSGNTTAFATTIGTLTNGNCVEIDAFGNFKAAAAACATSGGGGMGLTFCNLKNEMDTFYGPGSWSYYTTVGTGTDIAPAINACVTTFATMRGRGIIYIPATGPFALKTADIDLSGVYLQGDGSQASVVIFNPTSPGAAFNWIGTGGLTGGGARGIGLLLDTGLGATANVALQFKGNATYQPDQMQLNDLYITAVGAVSTWARGLYVDGSARTTPQGIRVGQIADVQIFNCTTTGAIFINAVQFSISNLGVYTGTGGGNDVYFAGLGTSSTNSIQLVIDNVSAAGQVNITNSSKFFVRGWASVIAVGTSATQGIIQMQATQSGTCGAGCTVTTF